VVGTEITVFESMATCFGEVFLAELMKGRCLGTAPGGFDCPRFSRPANAGSVTPRHCMDRRFDSPAWRTDRAT
jgi:hypothetical protein